MTGGLQFHSLRFKYLKKKLLFHFNGSILFGMSQYLVHLHKPFMDRRANGTRRYGKLKNLAMTFVLIANISLLRCLVYRHAAHVYVYYYFSLFFLRFECIQPSNGKSFLAKYWPRYQTQHFRKKSDKKSIARKREDRLFMMSFMTT